MHVVIVGAGSAGCATAGRLAERGHTVDLVEAGPDWRSETCAEEIRRPRDDIFAWRVDGRSPSRFAAPGITARRFAHGPAEPYLRGHGMGGTSAINGLVAIRPPDDEFVHWTQLGCEGWSWADVLPVFRRLEDDLNYGALPYHGRGGPIPVVRREESGWGSGDRLLAETAQTAGHAWEPDYHRPGSLGVSRTASCIRLGVRVTTYDAYVEPWRDEGRVSVHGSTAIHRVVICRGRAVAVEGTAPDGSAIRFEGDEIVLAGGAASTPALLQRSGIGPAGLLHELGIQEVANLPVGEGLQDHVGFWLNVELPQALPAVNGARGNVTLRTSSNLPHSRPGDVLVVAANPAAPSTGEVAFGVKLGHCLSRGHSRITSADPRAAPDIHLNLLADPRDRELARHAVRTSVDMLGSGGRGVRDRHGRPLGDLGDDTDADAWLRECARDTSHLTGGCQMGRGPSSVVDSRLRVREISGLTVADLSVCPVVPRANTFLTAVMVGERAADFLSPAPARARVSAGVRPEGSPPGGRPS